MKLEDVPDMNYYADQNKGEVSWLKFGICLNSKLLYDAYSIYRV